MADRHHVTGSSNAIVRISCIRRGLISVGGIYDKTYSPTHSIGLKLSPEFELFLRRPAAFTSTSVAVAVEAE